MRKVRNETNDEAVHDSKQELGRGNMPRDAVETIPKISSTVAPQEKKKNPYNVKISKWECARFGAVRKNCTIITLESAENVNSRQSFQ